MGTKLPELQKQLLALAHSIRTRKLYPEWIASEIERIEREIPRNPRARQTGPKHRRMTPQLGKRVRKYALDNPELSLEEIARKFDLNTGRISEAINGQHLDPLWEGSRLL